MLFVGQLAVTLLFEKKNTSKNRNTAKYGKDSGADCTPCNDVKQGIEGSHSIANDKPIAESGVYQKQKYYRYNAQCNTRDCPNKGFSGRLFQLLSPP